MLRAPLENADADKYYDVGRPDTVWIPDEIDEWVTNRPPIGISLPKLVMVKERFRRRRGLVIWIIAYSIMMLMLAFMVLIILSPTVGTSVNGRMDKLRAVALLIQGLIFFVPARRFYYSFIISNNGGGRGLLLGSERFIDLRTLDAPVKWDDVQAIEEVCGAKTVIGLNLTLTNPCIYSDKYMKNIINKWSYSNCIDQSKLYVDVGSFDNSREIVKIIRAKSVRASNTPPWVHKKPSPTLTGEHKKAS